MVYITCEYILRQYIYLPLYNLTFLLPKHLLPMYLEITVKTPFTHHYNEFNRVSFIDTFLSFSRFYDTVRHIFACFSANPPAIGSFSGTKKKDNGSGLPLPPAHYPSLYADAFFIFFDKIVTELLYRLQRFNHMNPLELDVHEYHYDA